MTLAFAVVVGLLGACQDPAPLPDPKIILVPGEAHPFDYILLTAHSDRVNFARCDNIQPESFVFSNDSNTGTISVQNTAVGSTGEVLTADLYVGKDALGRYDVRFHCNSATVLHGAFDVTPEETSAIVSIDPPQVASGVQRQRLTFSSPEGMFSGGLLQVDFDDGALNHIIFDPDSDVDFAPNDPNTMYVTVDVTPLAPPDAPIAVTVVTTTGVSRGELLVVQGFPASIDIEGSHTFERPSTNGAPISYPVRLQGTNMLFSKDTTISFLVGPDNTSAPGLVAQNVTPVSKKTLEFDFIISQNAYIGATRLRATTGKESAETQINIEAQSGDSVLKLEPRQVQRGVDDQPILATAINFDFGIQTQIECIDEGCDVTVNPILTPSKQVFLTVSISTEFKGETVQITVTQPGPHVVSATLLVTESSAPTISPVIDSLTQGDAFKGVKFQIANATFDGNVAVAMQERSGVLIDRRDPPSSEELDIWVYVAEDAPVGPSLVTIDNGPTRLETLLTVKPSTRVPWVTLSPTWIAQGRRTATLSLTANRFAFDEGAPTFLFDDPAIKVLDFEIDGKDPQKGTLTIQVSPVANSDLTVLYVTVGETRAAATFRVLDIDQPRFISITPSEITRGETRTFTIRTEGMSLGDTPPYVEIMSDIGVTLGDPILLGNDVRLEITAAATGEEGYVGILVRSDWHTVVAPLLITSENPSEPTLTMTVVPDTIELGKGPYTLELTIPGETGTTFMGSSEVFAYPEGTFATAPIINTENTTATIELDVGFGVTDSTVELFATTNVGGAVGFVTIESPETGVLDETKGEWISSVPLLPGENALLDLNPAPVPAADPVVLYSSAGKPDVAPARFSLISGNDLDTHEATGMAFIFTNSPIMQRVLVTPAENPKDNLTNGKLKSLFRTDLDQIMSEATQPALSLADDPCLKPVLAWGIINGPLDDDDISFETETSCPLVVDVVARSLVNRPHATPDPSFKDAMDGDVVQNGWPTAAQEDPQFYIPPGPQSDIIISAEHGSTGSYLVNIRRPTIIREISRPITSPYIELEVEPGTSIENMTLQLVDHNDVELASYDFAGKGIVNDDGVILIAGGPLPGADATDEAVAIFPPKDPFGLKLYVDAVLVDAVQVGDGSAGIGEGSPIVGSDENAVLMRIRSIDTDDNARDFVILWEGSYREGRF